MGERVEKAVQLFEQGYNCAQSVFMAFADIFGLEDQLAASVSTSFGGGLGRMREVCGAVSGGALLLGLKYPHLNPADPTAKNYNYQVVQKLVADFQTEIGSYKCADILGQKDRKNTPVSEPRTEKYYAERPCIRCVRVAAELMEKELIENKLIN